MSRGERTSFNLKYRGKESILSNPSTHALKAVAYSRISKVLATTHPGKSTWISPENFLNPSMIYPEYRRMLKIGITASITTLIVSPLDFVTTSRSHAISMTHTNVSLRIRLILSSVLVSGSIPISIAILRHLWRPAQQPSDCGWLNWHRTCVIR